MKTSTLPAHLVATGAPALPVRPRPLWERHKLFLEPDLPEIPGDLEDEEDEDGIITPR